MRCLIPRRDFETQMSNMFSNFWDEFLNEDFKFGLGAKTKYSYPKLNVQEKEYGYEISAGVPGLAKEDVKVELNGNILTISGENQNKKSKDENGYVLRELHKSSFARSLSLDEELLDLPKTEALVENGMLVVKIPKKKLDKPANKHTIEIQ
jgi:HSP20 family protein